MRILLLADLHANVLALENILGETKHEYDVLVHLGDSVGIGPYPVETLRLLKEQDNPVMILGNHEEELIDGIKNPRPSYMTKAEADHHKWIAEIIPDEIKTWVKTFKRELVLEFEAKRLRFLHSNYANGEYLPIPGDRRRYKSYFGPCDENVVCFGHSHRAECFGRNPLYVNPGSAGCGMDGTGSYGIIDIGKDDIKYIPRISKYNLEQLVKDLNERNVPARDETKGFYTRSAL